jgi:UDP-GlcNAc3NAcA epimerase
MAEGASNFADRDKLAMKILSVVGARPQFIKAAPVSRALASAGCSEYLVHTGQHYDYLLSDVFFDELGMQPPALNLQIGSGSHGRQTGQMLIGVEEAIQEQQPDWVLVYGDTNSTLAAALAAAKLCVPLAHVEAGLRSFNRTMPEEHNRVLTDHCADLLLCPTQTAVDLLAREGITQGVHLVGDTMVDAVLQAADLARTRSSIVEQLGLAEKRYLLATIHRPYNTDIAENLESIVSAFCELEEMLVFTVHPRTRQRLAELGLDERLKQSSHIRMIGPVGYFDMLRLEQQARLILTDSGGIQKEAYIFAVPCVTLRPETEWVETVAAGWNVLVHADRSKLLTTVREHAWPQSPPPPVFGDGSASRKIVTLLTARK